MRNTRPNQNRVTTAALFGTLLIIITASTARATELEDLQAVNATSQLLNWYNTPDKPVYTPGAQRRPEPTVIVVQPAPHRPKPIFEGMGE
jgi:hypothetical protein